MKKTAPGKLLTVLVILFFLLGSLAGSQQVTQAAPTHLPGTGMACFRGLDTIKARLTELVNDYPGLAEIVDIGDSWEKVDGVATTAGSDLLVLRLTNELVSGPKPAMFVISGLDSRDIQGVELNLRFAERLLSDYGTDPDVTMVLDTSEVHLLVVANPDGRQELERQFAAENGEYLTRDEAWGRNRNLTNCAFGVDLTRNFYPFDAIPSLICGKQYEGPEPESEPEALAIATYLRHLRNEFLYEDRAAPDAPVEENKAGLFISLTKWDPNHDFIYYPYHSSYLSDPTETANWTISLANKLANVPGNDDWLHAAKAPDLTWYGNLLDYAYGKLGVASLEMRIKSLSYLGRFPNCSQFTDTIVEAWLGALTKAGRSTPRPYEFAQGPEITSVSIFPPTLPFNQTWDVTGNVDARDYQRLDANNLPANPEGVDYSKDLPPWHESAVRSTATYTPDSSFNYLGTFSAQVEVDSTVLDGLQSVYLQAANTDGKLGIPRAVFLNRIYYLILPIVSR